MKKASKIIIISILIIMLNQILLPQIIGVARELNIDYR